MTTAELASYQNRQEHKCALISELGDDSVVYMAASLLSLVSAFDRVVKCPYPTQLKGFHDIIYDRCSTSEIKKCVREKKCQLPRLAAILLEAHQQWPYVAHIISRLSASVLFRDTVLRLQPRFLGDIIEQAVTSDPMSASLTSLAAAMLSHPLPKDYMLPAHGQTFFLRLIEQGTARPVISTVKPILDVLQGTSALLLSLLSSTSLFRFEEQLFSILRSSIVRSENEQSEGCLTLYCLVIMKVVIEASNDQFRLTASSFDGQDQLASTPGQVQQWNVDAMSKFFTKTKTLHLLVLRVMNAVRTHHNRSLEDQLIVLKLSNDLLGAIPGDLRSSWCAENVGLIERLEQRVRSEELDKDLQLQTFAFLFALSPPNHIKDTIAEVGRQIIVQGKVSVFMSEYAETDGVSSFIAGCITPKIMPVFLRSVLDVLSHSTPGEIVHLSSGYVRLLNKISLSITHDQELAEALVMTTLTPLVTSRLWSLTNAEYADSATQSRIDSEIPICTIVLREARCAVVHALSGLLISGAIAANNLGPSIPGQTITILLKLYAGHTTLPQVCFHDQNNRSDTAEDDGVFREDQQSDKVAKDWRGALLAHFTTKSRAEYKQVVQIFSQACADLESRCDAAEKPLHDERDAREALQEEYNLLNKAFSKLESHTINTELRLEVLEEGKSKDLRELECRRKLVDDLNARLLESQGILRRTVSMAESQKAESCSVLEQAKLEHASVLARMQEELEESQNRIDTKVEALKVKSQEMSVLQAELHCSQSAFKELSRDYERSKEALAVRDHQVASLEVSVKNETGRSLGFENRCNTMQAEMMHREENYHRDVQLAKEHADQAREQIKASGNAALERLATRHSEEIARIKQQLHKVDVQLDDAKAHHFTTITKRNDELLELGQQVERLQYRCEQKDKQIAQANAMRTNLMAAMGITRLEADGVQLHQSLPHRSRPLSSRESIQQAVPVVHGPSTLSPCPKWLDEKQHNHENSACALSHSSQEHKGPITKRRRPSKSLGQVTRARGHVEQERQIAQTRRPLLSLSVNQTPRKTETKSLVMQNQIRGEFSSDESNFAGSELLAGTAEHIEVDEMLQRLG